MPENVVPIVIGGEVIGVPPMNFASLKRAWPAIRALPDMRDAVEQAGAVVEIVAAALAAVRPELTIAEIEQRLSGGEVLALVGAAPRLLAASGLVRSEDAEPGKPAAG